MNLPRERGTRVATLALASLLAVGGGALADTLTVSLLSVNGVRQLHLTGAGLAGPATLSFNSASPLPAPFGVVVTDASYARRGYDVDASLSDLFPLGDDGALTCAGDRVPAGAFTLDPGLAVDTTNPGALVRSVASFTDANIVGNVNALLPVLSPSLLTGTIPLTVGPVSGLLQELPDTAGLSYMDVQPGAAALPFDDPGTHPGCPAQAPAPGDPVSTVALQGAATATPDLSALADAAFDAANGLDATMSAAEAVAAGILPANALVPGEGELWQATRATLVAQLDDALELILQSTGLDAITTSIVSELEAPALVFELLGQSGVYASVPTLTFDPDVAGDVRSGLYHGVLTVTLTDR